MNEIEQECIVICSWCKRQRRKGAKPRDADAWMDPEDVPEDELATTTGQKISHGICPNCIAIQRAELILLRQVQKAGEIA